MPTECVNIFKMPVHRRAFKMAACRDYASQQTGEDNIFFESCSNSMNFLLVLWKYSLECGMSFLNGRRFKHLEILHTTTVLEVQCSSISYLNERNWEHQCAGVRCYGLYCSSHLSPIYQSFLSVYRVSTLHLSVFNISFFMCQYVFRFFVCRSISAFNCLSSWVWLSIFGLFVFRSVSVCLSLVGLSPWERLSIYGLFAFKRMGSLR